MLCALSAFPSNIVSYSIDTTLTSTHYALALRTRPTPLPVSTFLLNSFLYTTLYATTTSFLYTTLYATTTTGTGPGPGAVPEYRQ